MTDVSSATQPAPPTQECPCCSVAKAPSQFKKFASCQMKPCNTVCNFCWTQYLKTDFMENPLKQLACFTCNAPMNKTKILDLLLKSPDDRKYYDYCLEKVMANQNGDRHCIFADCQNVQVQDINGRLSFCGWCSRQGCIACGIPEHFEETCEQYQTRMETLHSLEESATAKALAEGYVGREEVGKHGRLQTRPKHPLPCPSCGIWIERFGGCLRLRCPVCSLDFCGDCAAPYLGKNSVPLKGNAAHQEKCHYFKRKVEDRRFRPVSSVQESGSMDTQEDFDVVASEGKDHEDGDGGGTGIEFAKVEPGNED